MENFAERGFSRISVLCPDSKQFYTLIRKFFLYFTHNFFNHIKILVVDVTYHGKIGLRPRSRAKLSVVSATSVNKRNGRVEKIGDIVFHRFLDIFLNRFV